MKIKKKESWRLPINQELLQRLALKRTYFNRITFDVGRSSAAIFSFFTIENFPEQILTINANFIDNSRQQYAKQLFSISFIWSLSHNWSSIIVARIYWIWPINDDFAQQINNPLINWLWVAAQDLGMAFHSGRPIWPGRIFPRRGLTTPTAAAVRQFRADSAPANPVKK